MWTHLSLPEVCNNRRARKPGGEENSSLEVRNSQLVQDGRELKARPRKALDSGWTSARWRKPYRKVTCERIQFVKLKAFGDAISKIK